MKARFILVIFILIVVFIVVGLPLLEDIPALKGVKLPKLGFGLGTIGEQIGQMIEGITRSIKF
jgi:hypothetical protein